MVEQEESEVIFCRVIGIIMWLKEIIYNVIERKASVFYISRAVKQTQYLSNINAGIGAHSWIIVCINEIKRENVLLSFHCRVIIEQLL